MVIALCDVETKYEGDDSPRFNGSTPKALNRRELITKDGALTKRGSVYAQVAALELSKARKERGKT
jgi:hypothetical protein